MFGFTLSEGTAIISITVAIILLILRFIDYRRTVKVGMIFNPIIQDIYSPDNPFHIDYNLQLHCVNRTKRNIQIDKVGIKYDENPIYLEEAATTPKFSPTLLIDGEGFTLTVDVARIVEGLSKLNKNITSIQGFAIDAFNKTYNSKKISFDVASLFEHYQERTKTGPTILA